jgi:DNA mismatch repair protein MutS2
VLAKPGVKGALADPNPRRRGGRAVLSVRAGSASKVPGIVHDRSNTGETVFVEPREVVQPGNRLAEVAAEERREIERVLLELTRAVLAERPRIAESCARLERLELAFVGAAFAAETGGRVPRIGEDLLLRSARHPLLTLRLSRPNGGGPRVVPNDMALGGGAARLLVVSGPNTGGKTLALKMAGASALLVRCGVPVPCAEGSTVPLYDGIVADIGDEQEIRQSLSTFSSHLLRVKDGLRARRAGRSCSSTTRAGTDPDEGAALSEAVLELLLERGTPTLATTHIGKLKEFAFRHPRAENACVEFDPETLAPRYRILVGTPGESGALVVARRLGIPEAVVRRAEERLERRDEEFANLLAEVRTARVHAERVRSEAEERLEGVARDAGGGGGARGRRAEGRDARGGGATGDRGARAHVARASRARALRCSTRSRPSRAPASPRLSRRSRRRSPAPRSPSAGRRSSPA